MEEKEKFELLKRKGKERIENIKNYDYQAKMEQIHQTGQKSVRKLKSKKAKWLGIAVSCVVALLFVCLGLYKAMGILNLSPAHAVKNLFHTYQKAEAIIDQTGSQLPEDGQILQPILDSFKYKIVSVAQTDENHAAVTVEITAIDMTEVLKEVMAGMIDNKLGAADISESEEEQMQALLLEAVEKKRDTVTNTIEIPVEKQGWRWEAQPDETLVDAVLGGFYTALEKLNG